MDIEDLLSPTDAVVDVRATDKAALLQELAGRAALRLGLDREDLALALLRREDLGSTGMGEGVALPHARIPGLERPFGLLARLRRALVFDAVDGQPVDLVFLLLLPAGQQGEQLPALASVARRLRDAEVARRLRRSADAAGLYRALVDEDG